MFRSSFRRVCADSERVAVQIFFFGDGEFGMCNLVRIRVIAARMRWGFARRADAVAMIDSRAPRLWPALQCWEVRPSAAGHIKGNDTVSPVGASQEQLHNESCARCGVRKKTPLSCAFPAPPRTCQSQVATGSRKRHRSSQILWFQKEMASLNAPAEGGAQSVGGVWLEAEEHMDGFIVTDEFPSWAD